MRNFRRFYSGYLTSLLGSSMSAVAIVFAVLDSGGSAGDLGLVLAAVPGCQLIFLLIGGVVADRFGPRRIMLTGDTVRCSAQAAFAVLVLTGQAHVWLLVLLSAVRGTGEAFFNPGLSVLVVKIAPRERLGDANVMLGLAQSGAKVIGPALAGILVALTNPGVVIAIDAGTYVCSLIALSLLNVEISPHAPGRSMGRDLVEGWREFWSRTWLVATTVQFTFINLIVWGPFLVLGPTLSHQHPTGARNWGLIMAAYGVGSILGGLLALGKQPNRPLVTATIATFGYAAPCALFAVQAPVTAIAAGACLAGVGSTVSSAFADTATQHHTPTDVLARVRTFQTFGSFSFGPIAFAAAGPVAAVVGAHTVLGFGAAWAVVGSAVVLALPSVWAIKWGTLATDIPNVAPSDSPRVLPADEVGLNSEYR